MPVSTRRNKTQKLNVPPPEITVERFKIPAMRKRNREDDITPGPSKKKKTVDIVSDESNQNMNEMISMNIETGKTLLRWICKEKKTVDTVSDESNQNNHQNIKEMISINRETGKTPLHWTCINSNTKPLVQILGTLSININDEDKHGITPLHQAFSYNNHKAIQLLLTTPDINVNIPDKNGVTPLHRACYFNNYQVIPKLLAMPGINVNARDSHGKTPIMQSAKYGRIQALETLLDDPRLDIDARSCNGRGLEEMVVFGFSTAGHKSKCLELIQKAKRKDEEKKKNIHKSDKGYIKENMEDVRVNVRIQYIDKIEKLNVKIKDKEKLLNVKLESNKARMQELEDWQELEQNSVDIKFNPKIKKLEQKKYELEEKLSETKQSIYQMEKRKSRTSKEIGKRHRDERVRLEKKLNKEDKQEEQELCEMRDMIDQLRKHLENMEQAFDNGASLNEHETLEAAKDSLECPVCMELMKPPRQIWMCSSSHVVCESCMHKLRGKMCPTCRTLPVTQRAFIVEKIARTLFRNK